jgi:uncharacterized protein YjbI with pentapeptide repeats
MPLAHLEAPEFIKKIIEGERDFTGIRLTDHDTSGGQYTFMMLNEYLTTQDLKKNPIILIEAELDSIRAGGLWLPYLKARQASFKHAYFPLANFENGDFTRSTFFNTDLSGANCKACNFSNCYFKHTSFSQTQLHSADFRSADLLAASGLSDALGLAHVKLGRTAVSDDEQKAILRALQERPDFEKLNMESFFKVRR